MATREMTMAIDESSSRFPFVNLEKAIARASQLFEADRNSKPMPVPVAFELWGYSPKSSGAFQTIAALKSYGLLVDEGANEDRKVRLTKSARDYFLDERDDARSKLLQWFALQPPLFASLWSRDGWSHGVPADTVARSVLKLERNLSDQSARSALGIFKENLQFAGLKPLSTDYAIAADSDRPSVDFAPEPHMQSASSEAAGGYFAGMGLGLERSETAVNRIAQVIKEQIFPPAPAPSSKPIVFDMETVTVNGRFDNAESLRQFIEQLQRLVPLMPSAK